MPDRRANALDVSRWILRASGGLGFTGHWGNALRRFVSAAWRKRAFRGSRGEAASAALGALLAVVGFEAGYRCYLYRSLVSRTVRQIRSAHDPDSLDAYSALLHRCSTFDANLGYRYKPNLNVDAVVPLENLERRTFRTNSHGHIANEDYPVAKPRGEFRIVAIGDSFTAGVTNGVRWPDAMEAELQRHPEWLARFGCSRCRTINLGLDGLATVQYPAVYSCEAVRFEPDLVVVNLLADGMPRKAYFRGAHAGLADERDERAFAKARFVDPLPWFNPTPEFLARKPIGQRWGLRPKLDPNFQKLMTDEEEVMARSLAALRNIRQAHPRTVVLYHPSVQDWTGTLRPQLVSIRERLFREGEDLHIVDMAGHLPEMAAARDDLSAWYQVPHDGHPTDRGMTRYGVAAATVIMKRP